jgi:hypothetical protein
LRHSRLTLRPDPLAGLSPPERMAGQNNPTDNQYRYGDRGVENFEMI